MGRPREFDPEIALDRAMELFWAQGYEATSIDDLVKSMGIQRGSLYSTFKSKQDLFLEALERYRAHSVAATEEVLTGIESPVEAIEAALMRITDGAFEHKRRWGCLITNSSVELATRDSDVLTQVLAHRDRIEALFQTVIKKGQLLGEIRTDETPEALSSYIFGVIQGLRVMTKSAEERRELDDVVRITIDSLRG